MLDTIELTAMQFSKGGRIGTISQEADGRYRIQFECHTYIFEYQDYLLIKEVMDKFHLNKQVMDHEFVNKFDDVPF